MQRWRCWRSLHPSARRRLRRVHTAAYLVHLLPRIPAASERLPACVGEKLCRWCGFSLHRLDLSWPMWSRTADCFCVRRLLCSSLHFHDPQEVCCAVLCCAVSCRVAAYRTLQSFRSAKFSLRFPSFRSSLSDEDDRLPQTKPKAKPRRTRRSSLPNEENGAEIDVPVTAPSRYGMSQMFVLLEKHHKIRNLTSKSATFQFKAKGSDENKISRVTTAPPL